VFSRVHLRRLGEEFTSRYFVIARETFYQSPVRLTPYSDEHRIETARSARSSTTPTGRRASTPTTSTPAW
jgi:hypothetical protein